MARKTLFFDIDGCFHPHGVAKFNDIGTVYRAPDDGLFAWVDLLKPLLDEFPDLELVCHSSWRNLYTIDDLKKELPSLLADRTVGITEPYRDRHLGITEYAKENGCTQYVILDDDAWAFPSKTAELVLVPSHLGLSAPTAVNDLAQAIRNLYAASNNDMSM